MTGTMTVDGITESSLEDFASLYEQVNDLVNGQGKLQELVDAVNAKIKTLPEAFRPEELTIAGPSKAKTWRMSPEEKINWTYRTIKLYLNLVPDAKDIAVKDVWPVFVRLCHKLHSDPVFKGVKYVPSKSALSEGIKKLVEDKQLQKVETKNEDGVVVAALTRYKILNRLKKTGIVTSFSATEETTITEVDDEISNAEDKTEVHMGFVELAQKTSAN